MNPAASNFKSVAFFCKLVIDLISVCDYSSGESLQEFSGMFRMTGRLPVKEDDGMCAAHGTVPVDPHVSFLTIFDLCMLNPHDFYW